MKKISSFSRNNNNFLKLYIALFTFLSQTSNTFSFMEHTYYVAEDKRIVFKIMAYIFYLIPGTAFIIFQQNRQIISFILTVECSILHTAVFTDDSHLWQNHKILPL